MNILFVSHRVYPCHTGGAELFNYHLINALAKFHKMYVLTCCEEELDLDAVIIRINPRKFGLRRISIPLQDFIHILRLRTKIDLVHVSYMRANWFQWLSYPCLKKIFGVPYFVSIRGGSLHRWKPAFPHKFFFNNAGIIAGVSDEIKKEYERRTGREVNVVPSGLPFRQCQEEKSRLRDEYGFEPADTILLFLGTLKKIKGDDILLNAFIKLGRRYIEEHRLKLLFVGDGETRNDLEEKTHRENFDRYVKFFGSIPHEEVPVMFKMADIYVIPSLFEGTSNSMLEAMFNGMPIIGSDTSGINNIIKHKQNGLLFHVNDPEDLKRKIVYLIENKEIAVKIGQEAKKSYDERFSYENIVKNYLELYKRLEKARKRGIGKQN